MCTQPPYSPKKPLTLLIIDDDEHVLDFLKQYLTAFHQFQVTGVLSGSEALAHLTDYPYDAIIADYEMDGMSGIDLVKTLRRQGNDTPFIIFTGKGREEVVIESYESGADAYVQKGGDIKAQFADLANRITTIVEKRRAEQALVESEKHYRLLAENIIDVVWILDPETQYFRYVSPSVERHRGYSVEEILALPLEASLTPETGQRINNQIHSRMKAFISGDESPPFYRDEIEQQCKDGSNIWSEVISTYYRNEETGKIEIRGVSRNITQRREIEQRNRQSEAALRTVLDSMGDAVFIHDTTGQILDYNARMLRMFQISDPELVRQWSFASDYSAPDNPIGHLPKIWWEVMEGKNKFFEWKSRRPGDGSIFHTDMYMTRIDLPKGPAILVTIHDNTERKRAQLALEQVNKKLNLLSSITRHDILNSLTGMLGYLEFVHEHVVDGELKALIQKVETLARTIRTQINFTRDYQDLGVSVAQWQEISKVFTRAKNARIDAKITFGITLSGISIFADPMLEKVIYNLIDNAIRHGDRVTEMRTFWYEDNSGIVWVVEDNGEGVPEAMKERIFRRGVGKNTGLGLFLVREILSITGMSIRETGIPGKGARFEIVVPKGVYRSEGVPEIEGSIPKMTRQDTCSPDDSNLSDLVHHHLELLTPSEMNCMTDLQKSRCHQDINFHLDNLQSAVWAQSKRLFIEYIHWARTRNLGIGCPDECLQLSLKAIKAALIEIRQQSTISYLDEAISSLQNTIPVHPSYFRPDNPHYELARIFLQSILSRNKPIALERVQEKIRAGCSLQSMYLHVFQPALHEIGRLWHTNQISVAEEHYCTAAIQLIIAQFYLQVHSTPKTGMKMIALCVSGELHEVGMRMVADFFEMAGWDSIYLGANVPASSVLAIIREEQPPLLAISCTMTSHLHQVAELIQMIRSDEMIRGIKILVGGSPFTGEDTLWEHLGADACAKDAQEAVIIGKRVCDTPYSPYIR